MYALDVPDRLLPTAPVRWSFPYPTLLYLTRPDRCKPLIRARDLTSSMFKVFLIFESHSLLQNGNSCMRQTVECRCTQPFIKPTLPVRWSFPTSLSGISGLAAGGAGAGAQAVYLHCAAHVGTSTHIIGSVPITGRNLPTIDDRYINSPVNYTAIEILTIYIYLRQSRS